MTDKETNALSLSQSSLGTIRSNLKELVTKRSSIKGQITKFKNYLSQLKDQDQFSNIELAELNIKITKFEGLSIKFDNLQSDIEVLNADNIDFEIEERDNIERDIIIGIATAKTLVEAHTDNAKDQSQCFHDHQETSFKLPQIQISKYDGSYLRWLEFRDSYESLIHNNSRISPIHKFHYLTSYLEGDAARIISNLEVSSANYSEAWKIICDRQGHPLSDCRMGPCRICKQRHNSLLHNPLKEIKSNAAVRDNDTVVNFHNQTPNQVILSTALVEVCNPSTNQSEKIRVLLDCGSQSSFISKSLKEKLSLNSNHIDTIRVIGIGNNCTNNIIETCTTQLKSLNSSYQLNLSCLVLDKITSEIPKAPINIQNINLPENLPLADPVFHKPACIDVLLGADVFWEIIGNETRCIGERGPKLINSKFGWIISGPIPSKNKKYNKIYCNHALTKSSYNDIDDIIPKFWEIEELPKRPILSKNEKLCEKHFVSNTTRLNTGRFCVRLPLHDTPDCLGDSYNLAKRRLLNLERRFRRNPSLKIDYAKFINEYTELGHLSNLNFVKSLNSYYLCHHAVMKESSESTKLRVVFDGSASTSSGYALNDILMVGPNMQDSLFSILIRSRQYKYLLCGDIEKMYRQVEVNENDRALQLILWRGDESEPIQTLSLNTVTYGTASASYLSTRCIWQIGEEQNDELIKTIIKKDFYIDDLITGCDDEEQLRYIKHSVTKALSNGCFNLRKFKGNSKVIFENNSSNSQDNLTISESTSTLGLGWNPSSDSLNFPLKNIPKCNMVTKRNILSISFQIFDPLGLLSPCIIQPKIIMQNLWKEKIQRELAKIL
ncbi:uncharacterized protein LOC131842634 [Achroia grisella]|uniref:uncharacterized protein LOC131842634 n=1 Tax=Achroia grisella TaxID=688607 RepID=UPI0027D2A3F5|nr:uncharacterized protein LOC131842634 [Achroia grisella]